MRLRYLNLIFFFYIALSGYVSAQDNTDFPLFSKSHGFYDSDIEVVISADEGSVIYYTLDGSEPSDLNGFKYSTPVKISRTTVLRAAEYKNNILNGRINTATYLFTKDIVQQPNNPEGYPDKWGPYVEYEGNAIADYEMDPELMANPVFKVSCEDALKSLPVISLVTDKDNLFSHEKDSINGGIYIYTGPPMNGDAPGYGNGWERPVSFEFFNPDGSVSLQADCGIQMQGGHSRRPEKSPKHSFRLVFKEKYGSKKLAYPLFGKDATDEFNTIILRSGYGNTWINRNKNGRPKAQYTRDGWGKDSQRDMGHPAGNSFYANLFINGLYWGIYNPEERLDADFAESYLGGDAEDYDVIKDYTEIVDGNVIEWNKLVKQLNEGVQSNREYYKIRGMNEDGTKSLDNQAYIDVVSLADYILLNYYAGNKDWDHHNWVAMRNRNKPGSGFVFLCWDMEQILENLNDNVLNINNGGKPSGIFNKLLENNEFKRLFADRVLLHCFNNGALTHESIEERWMKRSLVVEKAIDAESARWGDYRRDVHKEYGPFELYTKFSHWYPERNNLLENYFPDRTEILISQLRAEGLFPEVDAPVFLVNGSEEYSGYIKKGDELRMTTESGSVYYTTNGSDPVVWDENGKGSVSINASRYSSSIVIDKSMIIRARTFNNGEWSAMQSNRFIIPEDYNDLRITEIHYHPNVTDTVDESKYEFIELKNTGISDLIVGGVRFTDGIDFIFNEDEVIKSGEIIVIAADERCFFNRYGFLPGGEFKGKLSNSGEKIVVVSPLNDTLCVVDYNDALPWPSGADGEGYSIVPVDINPDYQQNNPELWRTSIYFQGSPGRDDVLTNNVDETLKPIGFASEVIFSTYPNPFTEAVYIDIQTKERCDVQVSIFDVTGRKIIVLKQGISEEGMHQLKWDGTDKSGRKQPGGVYFCRVSVQGKGESKVLTRKLLMTGRSD
jgi:hypothetical protein